MKIVCDACQAKYSISDDKVQGKVFKIRCKKCSNIIVVRGGAGAAEAAPAPTQDKETHVYDYGYQGGDGAAAGDESVWHVVVNQEQVGPMTAGEVQQRFASGEIDAETFAWREGFTDWLPLAQVDAFAALAASGSATAARGGGGGANVAAMFGGAGGSDESGTMRSDPGDLFAAAGRGGASDDDGGDLFGSKPSSAAAEQAAAGNAKLRGERNENSVLFSLNNLAQLASKPAPAPSSSHGGGGGTAGAATGAAGGEGSGLIDIRSMASAYLGPSSGGASAKPTASSAIGSIDDLPVFSSGGFSDPVAIMPTSRPAANNKMMFILIGSVGVVALLAIVIVVLLMKGGGDKKTPDPTTGSAVAMGGGSDGSAKEGTDKAPDKTPDKAPDKTPDGSGSATAAEKTPDKTPDKVPDKTPTPTPTTNHTPTPTTNKTPDKAPPVDKKPPDTGGACDEVNCVISGYADACCAKYKKKGGTTAANPGVGEKPKSDLPESLDRDMIQKGVSQVRAKAQACGSKSSAKGQVKVSVKVGPGGNVTGVTVKSSPDDALGNCVAGAMKGATFAKTTGGGSFAIPFTF